MFLYSIRSIQNYIPKYLKHQINRQILYYLPCKFIKIMYKMGQNRKKLFIVNGYCMLFVNISSDCVHLLDDQDEHFLERNGIENALGPILLEYTQNHPVETLLLLNGPGGFTNLRVGTLTINMLNTLLDHDTGTFIPIASITKIELYTYAYQQGRLPRYGILYIGQKHNVWLYDFQEKTHKQITLEEIQYSDDLFLDWVHDSYWPTTEHMISFSMRNNTLFMQYNGNSHAIDLMSLRVPLTMTTAPEYLIQPTMN